MLFIGQSDYLSIFKNESNSELNKANIKIISV